MKKQRCTKCRRTKLLGEFYADHRKKNGKQAQCRVCMLAFVKRYYHEHPVKFLIVRSIARARKKGLPHRVVEADLIPLPTHCPVFGFKLVRSRGPQNPRAYSLDRINNRRGYVRGNVVVISYLANRLKNDGTAAQHERIAHWMRSMGDAS